MLLSSEETSTLRLRRSSFDSPSPISASKVRSSLRLDASQSVLATVTDPVAPA